MHIYPAKYLKNFNKSTSHYFQKVFLFEIFSFVDRDIREQTLIIFLPSHMTFFEPLCNIPNERTECNWATSSVDFC